MLSSDCVKGTQTSPPKMLASLLKTFEFVDCSAGRARRF